MVGGCGRCGMGGCGCGGCGGWMCSFFFFSLLLFVVAVDLASGRWWRWWVDVVVGGAKNSLVKRERERERE